MPEHVANGRDGPRACAGAQHMCVAAFIILFRLQRDCSASGMFATHNVPSQETGNLYLSLLTE